LGNSPAVRRKRMDMREWVEDDTRKEGGYWFAGHLPEDAHGESGTYNNWYCRCLPCTEGHTKAKRQRRKERWAERIWVETTETYPAHWYAPNAPEHGLSATLRNWGCHCHPCTSAELVKNKQK
jgi:hypothetical protein